MRKLFIAVLVLVAASFLLTIQLVLSGTRGQAGSEPRVVSVLGVAQVQGEEVLVHITVLVPRGQDERALAETALQGYGARRVDWAGLESQSYAVSGLVWDTLPVVQNYNPNDEPSGVDGQTALTNTHDMWDGVATSSYDIDFGGPTNRCPSLVDECPGLQEFDGFNDVTFTELRGPCNAIFGCTLGVTWYSTDIDEADMALNAKASWNDGCANVPGSFDAQTVIGHENGHVAGLGHSQNADALLYANYGGAMCSLHDDDKAGLSALYPADGATPEPTATEGPTATPTNTPEPTATATATATPGGPSTVSVDDISYATEGGRFSDRHLLVTVALVDASSQPVASASVSIDLKLDGALYASSTATTGTDGTVTLKFNNAAAGCYTTEVSAVTGAGTWDGQTPPNSFSKGGATCS